MIDKMQAIQSLVPGAEVSISVATGAVQWIKPAVAPVTEEQIANEQMRLQNNYDWYEYRRNRAKEYPSIEEQLDALYHAGVFPPEMAEKIRAVKEKYPPPQMSRELWLQRQIQSPSLPIYSPPLTPLPIGTPEPVISREEWLRQQL
jgi:hypothetical protein